MDRSTVLVYERRTEEWAARRPADRLRAAAAFGRRVGPGRLRADLGCGPGGHARALGAPLVAVDAAHAMLACVPENAPDALRVRADLEALPFARGALFGAWASKSYVHLPRVRLPLALAELHAALAVDAPVELRLFRRFRAPRKGRKDPFPGRLFSFWERDELADVLVGAGFRVDSIRGLRTEGHSRDWIVRAHRAHTLADSVGAGMRLLVCGLNPSLYAAERGVAFARPGNRFWPAVLRAGLASRDRDPLDALRRHGLGLTDLAKRATRRADELRPAEYREGLERVERLVSWLAPGAVCFVGLEGWRRCVSRRARSGWQEEALGGVPVYLMPSTSGLNAHARLEDLTAHLRRARRPPSRSAPRPL